MPVNVRNFITNIRKEHILAQIDQVMKNTLSSDLTIRPEFISGGTLLAPFVQHTAAQRGTMFNRHLTQALIVEGAEQPRISTGYEKIFGQYEFTTCRIDQDSLIRRVIAKFNPINYTTTVGQIPSWLVIYIGNEDREVHCMEVKTYTLLHDGFGYFNKMNCIEQNMLSEGTVIPKGTKLTTSPAHDGNKYMLGMNATVAFMGHRGVTEDAFVVSRSLAERGQNTAIQTVRITIDPSTIPLDLYGEDGIYKCFPSLGECVREDGAIIGLRKRSKSSLTDVEPANLRTIQHLHDEVHRAPPGATVIDVDVYINQDAVRKLKDQDMTPFRQFFDIADSHKWQQDEILKAYKQLCEKEGLPCSKEFNTKVVRAAALSNNREFVKKHIRLCDAREPIEFIVVDITYAYKRCITEGSKLTGREGGKGVVSSIWEDEDMPVDDNGIRADIIMTPASIINRMNPSQLFEQFWNRASIQVIRNAKDKWLGGWKASDGKQVDWISNTEFRKNWQSIYLYILEYFNMFREAYAKFVDEQLTALSQQTGNEEKMLFTEECLNDGLYLISGFRKPKTAEDYIAVAEKYHIEATPVTYREYNPETGEKETIRTKHPVFMGSKYLMLLGKIPGAALSSIEIGLVNQFENPMKPKSKHIKSQALQGMTPQKAGEDETCMLVMSLGGDKVARFFGLNSSAPEVVKDLARHLLNEDHPTSMLGLPMTTQDIINKNQNVSLNNHMMAIVGVDTVQDQ